jgi:hypothetical protein
MCWGDTCYTGETQVACSQLGGESIDNVFCVLPGEYAAIGPTCSGSTCSTGATSEACTAADGTNIADRWCVVKGRYSVVGPTCWDDTCFTGATKDACQAVGGENFADLFCATELPTPDVVVPETSSAANKILLTSVCGIVVVSVVAVWIQATVTMS